MKLRFLLKFDLFRLALVFLDLVVMALAMVLGYRLVFEAGVPEPFVIQRLYALALAVFTSLAVFAYLGVYSRRAPQMAEREIRLLVLGSLLAEGLSFLSQNAVEPSAWPYLLAFWGFLFLLRGGVGIYSAYRGYFFPAWQLVVVPAALALAGALLFRMQQADLVVPDATLPVSRTVHALYFFASTAGFLLSRWLLHWGYQQYKRPTGSQTKAIVVGADLELLLFSRLNQLSGGYRIVALLDNDPLKWGLWIHNARVIGGVSLLKEATRSMSVDTVLLLRDAVPADEAEIVERICREEGLRLVRIGNIQEGLLRGDSLSTSDLLDRKEYRYSPADGENYLKGRRVMVTGAGGSIGSELVRQILRCEPSKVILLGRGENSIFELERELQTSGLLAMTESVIVNVADRDGLANAFAKAKPQVVFHAAAHKHVPLMEANVREAVLNNVLGTQHVMQLAGETGVERVVMISTDKAVSPSSVMGATKRKAELVVADCAQQYQGTQYSVVRFGNVLGSRGSVVRLFLDQIRRGGPVTVTDPRMTRYFMTIPEAVSLVLASGKLGDGFGIYVLDMGKPYRIVELAEKMIRMCGMEPGRDIQIQFTGVRPGEKLDEVLVTEGEELVATSNPSIRRLTGAIPSESVPIELMDQSEGRLREWLLNL